MPRSRAPAAVLLLPLLMPAAALATAGPAAAQAPGGGLVVQLEALEAAYGSEGWKDAPPFAPLAGALPLPVPLPAEPFRVYENPYLGPPRGGPSPWLGHQATAVLALADAAGAPAAAPGHYVRARLETAEGDIPAWLAHLGPGRFAARFDLDGEAGTERPAVGPGVATLHVDVYEEARGPGAADRRVARAAFEVGAVAPRLDVGGLLVGDAVLGYADVGPGEHTPLLPRLARPGEAFTVIASFGVPGVPAALTAWHRSSGAVLVEGRTDASGVFAASVDPGQLVGGNASGLAVVAVHLAGAGQRLGAAVVAVPVGDQETRIVRMDYERRSAGPVPPQVPGPLDTLAVGVEDLAAGGPGEQAPARGTLHVLDPSGASASAPFDPLGFGPGPGERTARVPAGQLPRDNATYRLLAVLHTSDGRLYSLAHAVRGLGVVVPEVRGRAFEPGEVVVVVRNDNANLDDVVDEGLGLAVRLDVAGLPGGPVQHDVDVPEGGEARLRLPFLADAGAWPLEVVAVAGEFRRGVEATLVVEPPRAALPGFEASAMPAAGLAAALGLALARRGAQPPRTPR